MTTKELGDLGEKIACEYLVGKGFKILGKNWRISFGEIDIIARKARRYYFFEVKTGKSGGFVNPAENLTKEKLRKFLISVEHYCFMRNIKEYQVQGIIVILEGQNTKVEIIDLS